MNARRQSRRIFLRQALIGVSSLVSLPALNWFDRIGDENLVRVTAAHVNVHTHPNRNSDIVSRRARDELVKVYYSVEGDSGRNTKWYRVWGGFTHSAFLQPVRVSLNPVASEIPESGALAEVSVPFSQSYRQSRTGRWELNYRLYYGSVHWITGINEGPDSRTWYLLNDSYGRTYHALAEHLRIISDEELSPITPEIPREKKWIEIAIGEQELTAYENDVIVMRTKISSGVRQLTPIEPDQIPSDTPLGHHHITVKTPSRHMGDTDLTGSPETGALPGVPWVSFFHKTGVALHGTYWHDNFGVRMSRGCINMRNEDAKWIYRWVQPFILPKERQTSAWGTRVYVHD